MSVANPRTSGVRRHWLAAIGLGTFTVVAAAESGVPGLVVGGVVALTWVRLPGPYAFAVGQFGLLAIAPELPGPGDGLADAHLLIAAAELGLLALLVAPPRDAAQSPTATTVLGTVGAATLGGLLGWAAVDLFGSIWLAAVACGGAGALVALGAREYELWGLDEPARTTPINNQETREDT